MARTARDGRVTVYPTGWIEISGHTESGHELEITLGREEAEVLVETFRLEALMEDGKLGHAFWHARQPEIAFPCSSCDIKREGHVGPIDLYTFDGYRGPSAMTDEEREANVNEILEFEKANPETPAQFVNRLTDEVLAATQDPNKGSR